MDRAITDSSSREVLIVEFERVRRYTEQLCSPLATDDYQIQSTVQTSPPEWHIAHVSWLFDAFVLPKFDSSYHPFDPRFDRLFNSYYYTHGDMQPRPRRGLLSRPTVEEIYRYRADVDERVRELLERVSEARWRELAFYVILALNHEEQHQELMLMDIKQNSSVNPLKSAYREDLQTPQGASRTIRWLELSGGIRPIGYDGDGFAYNNETPRQEVLLRDRRLADRFVTNGEYQTFIDGGGYSHPALWLSDGWAVLQREGCRYPLYWEQHYNGWQQFTLGGMRQLNPHEPVCHLSFYEADAYARWAGKRLPQEGELENLPAEQPLSGNFGDRELLHPAPDGAEGQWFGDLLVCTASPSAQGLTAPPPQCWYQALCKPGILFEPDVAEWVWMRQ